MNKSALFLAIAATASAAFGNQLQFQTVFDAQTAFDASDTALLSIDQVVAGNGGKVAVLGLAGPTDWSSSYNAVLYHNAATTNIVAAQDQNIWPAGSADTFSSFHNLAMSGSGLTFAARTSGGVNSFGVFQQSFAGTSSRVLASGDTLDGGAFQFHHTSYRVSLDVNSGGQTLFGGTNPAEVLVRGSGSSSTTMVQASSALWNFNEPSSGMIYPVKRAITASGSAVFIADAPTGNRQIVQVASPLANPSVRYNPASIIGGSTHTPAVLLGATDDTVLFRATVDGNAAHESIVLSGPAGIQVLGDYYRSTPAAPQYVRGELANSGDAAFFLPNADASATGAVKFYNHNTNLLSQIAQLGDSIADGVGTSPITAFSLASSVPMVNDSGTVVFDAELLVNGEAQQSLLWWTPTMSAPQLVARTGEVITIAINGIATEVTISSIYSNTLDSDASVSKDGLSEDNLLSFGISYYVSDPYDTYDAVLSTALPVPEPAAVGLLGLALVGLVRRRAI